MWYSALVMLHHITVFKIDFLGARCSGVECRYPVSLIILLSITSFIEVITSIADMCMAMTIPLNVQI